MILGCRHDSANAVRGPTKGYIIQQTQICCYSAMLTLFPEIMSYQRFGSRLNPILAGLLCPICCKVDDSWDLLCRPLSDPSLYSVMSFSAYNLLLSTRITRIPNQRGGIGIPTESYTLEWVETAIILILSYEYYKPQLSFTQGGHCMTITRVFGPHGMGGYFPTFFVGAAVTAAAAVHSFDHQ